MSQIRIRRSKNKHSANAISKLDKICFPDDYPVDPQAPNTIWWIAWADGEPIAYAGIEQHKTWWFLCRVGVAPDWRGKGIQKQLIKKRVEYARSVNDCPLYTHTVVNNAASSNSLISCGFRIFDPPWDWWKGCNVWKYRDKS